ncbi:MAG: two-component system, OmpR family, sensor histidine kinase BaeS [Actinomycetota bacterium]|nr:two-component system, OmpR family, sensor histidine kinase BaeS [Actinomycetota bacterium]
MPDPPEGAPGDGDALRNDLDRSSRSRVVGPLTARLALAFLAVALGALALFSILVLVATAREVAGLARRQQDQTAADVVQAAGVAYATAERNGVGWDGAHLETLHALAHLGGGEVVVLDESGGIVEGSPPKTSPGRIVQRDVVVGGRRVGSVLVAFSRGGLPGADRHLRNALIETVAVGAGAAALLALSAAIAVSRRITRPVVALTETVRAVEGGDKSARVGDIGAPGELGALAGAFDRMADALALEDSLRRIQVADVAHELRTPLTVLQATLEAMADGVVAAGPAQLASVHDEVLRLIKIVEDLETLAAADATGLVLEPGPVDLANVAARALAMLRPRFEAADLRLEARLTPVTVLGDADRLHQVVTNLLTNALKFTPAGGHVEIETGPGEGPDGGSAYLSVADSGAGIPPDELPHVFDRFWRGSQAVRVAGSGIGLTVVQRLVEAHKGTVSIESRSGEGTTVMLTFRVAPPAPPQAD